MELHDFTFIFIVRIDSIDRLENIILCTSYLSSQFLTTIEVLECASYNNGILKNLLDKNIKYEFEKDNDPILYRTRFLNRMTKKVLTPNISIWDSDVLIPFSQIMDTVSILRNCDADFVYPYSDQFLDTSYILKKLYQENRKIEVFESNTKKMKKMYLPKPNGGVFFANLESYRNSGMENENYYGWGVEDGDRLNRWRTLNYNIKRVEGPLYHLTHKKLDNSSFHNPDQPVIKFKELFRIRRKEKDDLLDEIKTWEK